MGGKLRKFIQSAAALMVAAASPAVAGEQDFVLVNNTGYAVEEVYVSPTRVADWQEDVLGADMLPDGSRVTITFDRSEDSCLWDLKVVYEDTEAVEWPSFNLCEISVITISYDEDTGDTIADYE